MEMTDLRDRVPEELRMEVRDTVQAVMLKTTPKKSSTRKQNGCLGRPPRRRSKAEKERRLPREAPQTAKQSGKGKMHPSECRVPKNSKKR